MISIFFKTALHNHPEEETFADSFFLNLFNEEELDFERDFFQYLNMGERYVYRGSLTSTPYTEPILWNILPQVIQISPRAMTYFGGNKRVERSFNDYDTFGEDISFGGENRETMPINGRQIIKIDIPELTSAAVESEVAYFT